MHGVLLVPWRSRLQVAPNEHFRRHLDLYLGGKSGLDRLDVRPIDRSPDRVVAYILKAVRARRVAWDSVLFLPKSLSEL